jgi:uncharacterized repeat protein (TIGR02543 family)
LTKTGYTFSGWNTAANGSGTAYAGGASFTIPASNTTLFAQWTASTTYTMTYDANGGTGTLTDPSSPYTSGATVTVLNPTAGPITRTGYTFAHWNTAPNDSGTSYSPTNTFTILANTTLYAIWTVNNYTVTYDGNTNTGGTAPASQSGDYNTSITLAGAGTLTKNGYIFAGWNTAADGSGTEYAAGASFTIPANNVTLYAQWIFLHVVSRSYSYNGVSTTVTVTLSGPPNQTLNIEYATGLVPNNWTAYLSNPVNTTGTGTFTIMITGSGDLRPPTGLWKNMFFRASK